MAPQVREAVAPGPREALKEDEDDPKKGIRDTQAIHSCGFLMEFKGDSTENHMKPLGFPCFPMFSLSDIEVSSKFVPLKTQQSQ